MVDKCTEHENEVNKEETINESWEAPSSLSLLQGNYGRIQAHLIQSCQKGKF